MFSLAQALAGQQVRTEMVDLMAQASVADHEGIQQLVVLLAFLSLDFWRVPNREAMRRRTQASVAAY